MARNLSAQSRKETGKNENNRLRSSGFIPAIMYSHGKSELLQINKKEFGSVFKNHISESIIIDLDISGKEKCVVYVKDYQLDPVSDEVIHLDFYKITQGEKIKTQVPLETTGAPIGVRMGGVFDQIDRMLHVECLPSELPEKIIIDISSLDLNQSIHVKDIPVPASMRILLDPEHVVAHVTKMKEEVVEEAASEGAAAPAAATSSSASAAAAPAAKKK